MSKASEANVLPTLFERLFDYAGLFPPANLSMTNAIREYHEHLEGDEAKVMDLFVCTTLQLPLLEESILKASPNEALKLCLIGRGGKTRDEWEFGLAQDLADTNALNGDLRDHIELLAYETKIPDNKDFRHYWNCLGGFESIDRFVELQWDDSLLNVLEIAAEEVAIAEKHDSDLFLKLRTGGKTAQAFPDVEQVAQFIQGCAQLLISFKFTAGLHQPITHFDPIIKCGAFGFLNVLFATSLALAHDLSLKEITEVLTFQDPSEIKIHPDVLMTPWGPLEFIDIQCGRDLIAKIGSCSVTEPVQALKELGWWQKI